MTETKERKHFRTFFHVKPAPLYRKSKGKKQIIRLDWICEGDRNTRKYLKDVFDLTVGDKQTFAMKKLAMAMAKSLCLQFKPSERIEHRMPEPGEHGFPIRDRSTYGDDPSPPVGVKKLRSKEYKRKKR